MHYCIGGSLHYLENDKTDHLLENRNFKNFTLQKFASLNTNDHLDCHAILFLKYLEMESVLELLKMTKNHDVSVFPIVYCNI